MVGWHDGQPTPPSAAESYLRGSPARWRAVGWHGGQPTPPSAAESCLRGSPARWRAVGWHYDHGGGERQEHAGFS